MSMRFAKALAAGKDKRLQDLALRTPATPYTAVHSDLFGLDCEKEAGPSMTKQAEAEACDINNIMKRYEQTGLLPQLSEKIAQYGEFADVPTYMESMAVVAQASNAFAELPADTRAFFHNDPSRFLDYMDKAPNDEKKFEKLIELGLMKRPEPVRPDPNLLALKEIAKNTKQKPGSAASSAKDDPE